MTTLITITLLLAGTAACVLLFDKAKRELRRSNRETVRRVQRYLEALPPARPW